MKLTDQVFMEAIDALEHNYINWNLPNTSLSTWKNVLTLAISDEFLLQVIVDWITNVTTPPKNPAEIIKHANNMFKKKYDSPDTAAELLIDSARKAYTVSDDFVAFDEMYRDSFAYGISRIPAQEAYIKENIEKRSKNPKVLILVYDEVKGDLKSCFTGDAEHGIDFLRGQIKKKWNDKMTDAAKEFLKADGATGFLEA